MKPMRIYIAGPMSNLPELNFPAFHEAADRLRAAGHEVVNPADLCNDIAGQWAACMRRDLTAMLTCEAVALLPGWAKSRGATLECQVADALGMTCQAVDSFLAFAPQVEHAR